MLVRASMILGRCCVLVLLCQPALVGHAADLPTGTTYYPADNAQFRDPKISAGPGVMLAYWNKPEQPAAAVRNG